MNEIFNLLEKGEYNRVREEIFNLFPFLDDQKEVTRAFRLVGLSFYKNNEFLKSVPWFRKAAKQSQSTSDWFNLASSAAQAGQTQLALEAFHTLEELHKASGFRVKPSFWVHLYWFIISLINGEEYSIGLKMLERLKMAYQRARFMDKRYFLK